MHLPAFGIPHASTSRRRPYDIRSLRNHLLLFSQVDHAAIKARAIATTQNALEEIVAARLFKLGVKKGKSDTQKVFSRMVRSASPARSIRIRQQGRPLPSLASTAARPSRAQGKPRSRFGCSLFVAGAGDQSGNTSMCGFRIRRSILRTLKRRFRCTRLKCTNCGRGSALWTLKYRFVGRRSTVNLEVWSGRRSTENLEMLAASSSSSSSSSPLRASTLCAPTHGNQAHTPSTPRFSLGNEDTSDASSIAAASH